MTTADHWQLSSDLRWPKQIAAINGEGGTPCRRVARRVPSIRRFCFRQDLETQLRQQVREAIETVLQVELTEALGSARHERSERRAGYRHGALERTITTAEGPRTLRVPRGRVRDDNGATKEFRSRLLPRYARRTRDVDAAVLSSYLAGANTRRIRTALKPLLGDRHLSKSAVSRYHGNWPERARGAATGRQ